MSKATRRGFLKQAGAVGAAGAAPSQAAPAPAVPQTGYRRSSFAPQGAPKPLSENLFLFEDTCNVYLIRDGSRGVLIDFGSGKILDHLGELGVSRIDWILHTHHHRDQCQGDYKAAERGIPIAIPAHEKDLFAEARNFWRNRRIFHLYYLRNDFNTLTENIPVAQALQDYSTLKWGKTEFFVMPTPGHTLGSITLITTVDGKRLAFTGDLLYSPGKIQNLYDTQINYGGAEGIGLGVYSLSQLRERKPEMLLPSHGEVMASPDDAIAQTVRVLTDYYTFATGNPPPVVHQPQVVSPHLICHWATTSTFYALLSNSGKAMFIDYGSATNQHFSTFERATAPAGDRIRFVEHSIERLKREYGMKSIDVAMPTHMHDDHMNGFPHLQRHYGTRMWCYENMQDIFEHPRGHNLGCTLGEPFRVDRTFRHGERFRWEEYDFEITHSPGHTEYQMALFVTVDGKKLAFTGDAFFPVPSGDTAMRHNIIYRNHVENDSHLKSIRNLIEHEPAVVCPGHGQPFAVDKPLMLATEQKFRKQQQWFRDLLPPGEIDFGLDPSWLKIYPYQILIAPGEKQKLRIDARNYYAEPMKVEVALIAPAEWGITPDVVRLEIPAGASGSQHIDVSIPNNWAAPGPRFAIAADVVRNGRYLGQITEAVVELRGAF